MIVRVLARKFSTKTAGLVAERLPSRGLLRVSGQNVPGFLQGIVTTDLIDFVAREGPDAATYSHVLNVKGRVMYDLFIYKDPRGANAGEDDASLLVEADVDALARLAALIKMYRVRRKIDIERSDEFSIWNVHQADLDVPECDPKASAGAVVVRDPRLPFLGFRLLVPKNVEKPELDAEVKTVEDGGDECYRRLRYKLGVPEGIKEIPPGDVTPLEYNLDLLNGVSFSKGCYIGQELTARTKHTGVIRKRVMPLILPASPDNAPSLSGATIVNPSGKNVGKVVAAYPRMREAIGLIRFGTALRTPDDLRIPTSNDLKVLVRSPDWWPEEVLRIPAGQDEAAAAGFTPSADTGGGPSTKLFTPTKSS